LSVARIIVALMFLVFVPLIVLSWAQNHSLVPTSAKISLKIGANSNRPGHACQRKMPLRTAAQSAKHVLSSML
jgi:hypothetical protein